MKKLMTMLAALSALVGLKADVPEGYTDLGGTYSFQVSDAHAYSGKWYISGEFQPVNGAEIDGADWYVDNLIAFQSNGQVLNLKSGTLLWTATSWGGGVYPDNNTKYLNFVPGSTLKCINPNLTTAQIFPKCFQDQWSNFRFNDERITDETRFNELFTVETTDLGTTFYLKPSDSIYFSSTSVEAAGTGAIKLTGTFTSEGDGTAAITAAWDTADQGDSLDSWANTLDLGTLSNFLANGGTISGLSDGVNYSIRLFATVGSTTTCSSCLTVMLYQNELITGTVNKWIGGEGTYSTAANWSLGHVPTTSEVRWVEDGVIDMDGAVFEAYPQDLLVGGKVVAKELVFTHAGINLRGTSFEFEVFSMNTFTGGADISAGNIVATNTRENSFWRGNDNVYVNVPATSTAIFTVPFSVADTYTRLIATGKIRGGGEVISETDFADADQWTVTAISDSKTSFRRKLVVAGAPVVSSLALALDSASDTTVLVQAAFTSETTITGATVNYGTEYGNLTESLSLTGSALNPEDGILRFTVPNLERKTKYYFTVTVANSTATVESDAKGIVAYEPVAPEIVWIGGVSEKASVAENWQPVGVPTADSEVEVLDTMAKGSKLDWDLTTGVKSWTQKSVEGGSVRVTLFTTLDQAFEVSGNLTVLSGIWRVQRNESLGLEPTYALNLKVGGDLTVGSGAVLHAGMGENDAARAGSGWFRGSVDGVWVGGAGYVDIGGEDLEHWPLYGRGSSFGGDGGYRTLDFALYNDGDTTKYAVPAYTLPLTFTSYGKILDPLDWGSSGHGDNANFAGGGVVKIVAGGALVLNGAVDAIGFGYPGLTLTTSHNGTAGASTGGSINLSAKTLAGSGTINANGGGDPYGGNGSGGRIRIKLTGSDATFDGNSITMKAYGGNLYNPVANVVDAAAGTIALQTAADDATSGTVIIQNLRRTLNGEAVPAGATHFPAMQNGDAKLNGVKLEVAANTWVRLTKSVSIAELTCNGVTLQRGQYTAAELNAAVGAEQFLGEDGVVLTLGQRGTMVIIR